MGKIELDRSGTLRAGIFYRFHTFNDDHFDSLGVAPDWIIARVNESQDGPRKSRHSICIWLEDLLKNRHESKECQLDATHVTYRYYDPPVADAHGGDRLSSFVPTFAESFFAVDANLRTRLETAMVRGARIDPVKIQVNQSR